MSKTAIRVLSALFALALGIASSVALAEDPGVTATTIKFGQAAALDGSAANLGKGMRAGLLAAFNEANAAGGVNGRKIELVSHDDGYDPDKSIAAVKQLIDDDKVFALVGSVGTPTANATFPIAGEKGVPFIGAFTGAKSLRDPKLTHIVNLRASYGQETEAWIEHLTKDLGIKKIAAFYQDDSYGQAGLSGIKEAMQKRGLELVAEGTYARNTTAVKSALTTIRAGEPEAVVMVCAYAAGAEFIKLAKKLKMDPVFVNISFVGSDALAKELGAEGEGVVITQVVPYYGDASVPLVAAYQSALKTSDPQEKPGFVSLEGYAVGRLVVEALKRVKGDLTRPALLAALSNGTYDLGGLKLEYGNGRTQGSDAVFLTVVQKDGTFKPVSVLTK